MKSLEKAVSDRSLGTTSTFSSVSAFSRRTLGSRRSFSTKKFRVYRPRTSAVEIVGVNNELSDYSEQTSESTKQYLDSLHNLERDRVSLWYSKTLSNVSLGLGRKIRTLKRSDTQNLISEEPREGSISLDWYEPKIRSSETVCLFVPGLQARNYYGGTIHRIGDVVNSAGMRLAVLPSTSDVFSSRIQTNHLSTALKSLSGKPVVLIGHCLGGVNILKYLIQQRFQPKSYIRGVYLISSPVEPLKCIEALERKFFGRMLSRYLTHKSQIFSDKKFKKPCKLSKTINYASESFRYQDINMEDFNFMKTLETMEYELDFSFPVIFFSVKDDILWSEEMYAAVDSFTKLHQNFVHIKASLGGHNSFATRKTSFHSFSERSLGTFLEIIAK
eukprot:snap_masked-scaffold_51-processed-gene-1.0-mRNA-1 protein AED:0.08 eAED:1.00 QI:0/-1/0/1/-1/1/1/0/386